MRGAFSNIFARFFARAYLEGKGYRYFSPISRDVERIADNLYVIRPSEGGDMADWLCSKTEDANNDADIALGEAKGLRRQLNFKDGLNTQTLRKANAQLRNTLVYRTDDPDAARRKDALRVKGFAVLFRWANERNALEPRMRVLDPDTLGESVQPEVYRDVGPQIAAAHMSNFLNGLGFQDIAGRLQPRLRTTPSKEAIRSMLEAYMQRLDERTADLGLTSQDELPSEETARMEYVKITKRQICLLETRIDELAETYASALTASLVYREEYTPRFRHAVRLANGPLQDVKFLGTLIGAKGFVPAPDVRDLVAAIRRTPALGEHFLFVGQAVETLRNPLERGWRSGTFLPQRIKDRIGEARATAVQDVADPGIQVSPAGAVVGPASMIAVQEKVRI
ncbi:hypothetical protein DRB17_17120 [Ferruginivarius sediminum]|uniref:Uncharacterized protein n=1 Tax=Ferruginivarius sediminum TaxID=2661937 RepID=A0A369T5I4_9PROT|nr:hypothetical protein DRB17_17120 [Ferruginivarius sediminum]